MDRGQYSPNGAYPQQLPDYWKFEDGTIRTDLPELSDQELEELGWYGPITLPPFEGTTGYTHEFNWNKQTFTFDVRERDIDEVSRIVGYRRFWDQFIETNAYVNIRNLAIHSLEINVYCTEFIALLSDAKMGHINRQKIQESITNIFSNVTFTDEEIEEIQEIFVSTGMCHCYTLQ